MSKRSSTNRILVIGRETGPLANQIKKSFPNMKINSVDILGNLDTRKSVDSAFSILKQYPGETLEREKGRSDIDLLYELTLIMLEEVDFDKLIPQTPFNSNPDYLKSLSKEITLLDVDWKNLEKTSSAWNFLYHTSRLDSSLSLSDRMIEFEELFKGESGDGLFISKKGSIFINTECNKTDNVFIHEKGFFLPITEIYSAAFYSSPESITFIGIQMVRSPRNHEFFCTELEKNAFYHIDFQPKMPIEEIIMSLRNIIQRDELIGFLTIFFGVCDGKIVPIACNSVSDEKIDLWNRLTANDLIPLIIESSISSSLKSFPRNYGYKIPIFSSHPIKVPMIPKELAEQRNLPGVYNTTDYPVCTIQNYSHDIKILAREVEVQLQKIHEILK